MNKLSSQIKYIIFDWGGICTYGNLLKDFCLNLSIKSGINNQKIEKVFRELKYPYETGKIQPKNFWKEFKKRLDLTLSIKEIQKLFHNSYKLNSEVLDCILDLRKKYSTVLFTNNYEDLFNFIKKEYDLKKYFDYLFSSSIIKNKKPEKQAYDYIIKKLNLDPREAIFVDNKEKNIIGAQKAGFKTYQFKDFDLMKQFFNKIKI